MKLYIPRFFSTPYEKEIDKALHDRKRLIEESQNYQVLIDLKRHASKVATNVHELRGILSRVDAEKLIEMEMELQAFFIATCKQEKYSVENFNLIENYLRLVDSTIQEKQFNYHCNSSFVLTSSVIVGGVSLGGVAIGSMMFAYAAMGTFMVCSGPVGAVCVAAAIALVSTALFLLAAYTAYVEIQFLMDKQYNELRETINEIDPRVTVINPTIHSEERPWTADATTTRDYYTGDLAPSAPPTTYFCS